jgi:hypothetical protein
VAKHATTTEEIAMTSPTANRQDYIPGLDDGRWRLRVDRYFVRRRLDGYRFRRRLPLLGWRLPGLVERPGMTLVGHVEDGGRDQRGYYFYLIFDAAKEDGEGLTIRDVLQTLSPAHRGVLQGPGGGGSVRVYYQDVHLETIRRTTIFEQSIAPPARRRRGRASRGGGDMLVCPLVCPCGNTDGDSGFSPCDPQGHPVEPVAAVNGPYCTATWAEPLYLCRACGRVLHDELLVVVDRVRQQPTDPFDPATAATRRLVLRPRAPHHGAS